MKQGFLTIFSTAFMAAALSSPAAAQNQGQSSGGAIGSLPVGSYACESPGDASGRAGVRQPARDFTITGASTYTQDGERGTYLMRGNRVQMTSGPMQGQRYAVRGSNLVREIADDGSPGRLRCIRR